MEEPQYQQQPPQQSQQSQQQYQQQPKSSFRNRNTSTITTIAPYFIMIGAILIGLGAIIMGFAPGHITIEDTSYSGGSTDVELSITPITIGAILAGIGAIFSGLGAGLNMKAYWDKKEQVSPPPGGFS